MSKKELRKELEITLIKSLEEVLSKRNAEATKKISNTIHDASKNGSKKVSKNHKIDFSKQNSSPKKDY